MKVREISWFGWLNIFIMQWLFCRITWHTTPVRHQVDGASSFAYAGRRVSGAEIEVYVTRTEAFYTVMYFVVPLTGWWSKFVYLGKRRHRRLTKTRYVQ